MKDLKFSGSKHKEVSYEWLKKRIVPEVFQHAGLALNNIIYEIYPDQLFFNVDRFDLTPKYLWAKDIYNKKEIGWYSELYEKHISAFTQGSFEEASKSKKGIEDYNEKFRNIISSIKSRGFDKNKTVLPINKNGFILDGAHRLAAAYLLKQKIWVAQFDYDQSYDYNFFRAKKLPAFYRDAIVHEYCKLNSRVLICQLFPCAFGQEDKVRALLEEIGDIYYYKEMKVSKEGAAILIQQTYINEQWIGSIADRYFGARERAQVSFKGKFPLRLFVINSHSSLDRVKQIKEKIRNLYKLGNYSVHINDYHDEAIRLAGLLFNKNSEHFLNYVEIRDFKTFYRLFNSFNKLLEDQNLSPNNFCIDTSAVMSIYGVRDCRDLDYINMGQDIKNVDNSNLGIDNHSAEAIYHIDSIKNLIYHPKNHFYYDEKKFLSLNKIMEMKKIRLETKDYLDIGLIRIHLLFLPRKAKRLIKLLFAELFYWRQKVLFLIEVIKRKF